MDRERAETFLRLLAEAELRDLSPPPLHAGGATDFPFFTVPVPVRRAAWALIEPAIAGTMEHCAGRTLAGRLGAAGGCGRKYVRLLVYCRDGHIYTARVAGRGASAW